MDNQGTRQMFDVDVNCGTCNSKITQLPFQPSGDRPVYCQDCNRARQDAQPRERKMYDVDVACAGCGTKITQLPFEPRDGSDINCRDCYMKSKNS